MDPILKEQPTKEAWLALLDALRGEARAGRLRSLTFMLQQGDDADICIIDHFGPAEVTEIACRKTVEAISAAMVVSNASLAKAIRDGMPQHLPAASTR